MTLPRDDVRILPSAGALGATVAAALLDTLGPVTSAGSRGARTADLAVAGGFVCSQVLARVDAQDPRVDWSQVRVWWADERFVPTGDPDRNDSQAVAALFARTPGVRLRRMPADDGTTLADAAEQYRTQWRAEMAGRPLDLALLGMGPDGHVASLFPGHRTVEDATGREVLVEEHSPKPPPRRLTLSRTVLTAARRIWVVAAGSAKAPALARVLAGASPSEAPVSALRGPRTTWWLDQDLAASLQASGVLPA